MGSKPTKSTTSNTTKSASGGGGGGGGKGGGSSGQGFEANYDIGKTLGKGNYSVVKLCKKKRSGEEFAVKVMEKAKLAKEDIDAIKVEVGTLRALHHTNIIKLEDTFDEPRYYYLITELMSGGELFDRIVKKSFYSETDGQKVVRVLADVLAYMHGMGYVHRDLKPENILLKDKSEDAIIKIADFGFARPVGDGCRTACGTPGYVAPEIVSFFFFFNGVKRTEQYIFN
jgi:calcium/calmodulin-dependent protein kinase I